MLSVFFRNAFAGTNFPSGAAFRTVGFEQFSQGDAVAGPSGMQSSPSLPGPSGMQSSPSLPGPSNEQSRSQTGIGSVHSSRSSLSGTVIVQSRPCLPGVSSGQSRPSSSSSQNRLSQPSGTGPLRFRPPVITGRGNKILQLSLARTEEKAGESGTVFYDEIGHDDELSVPLGTVVATTKTAVIVDDADEVDFS
jgi:hypothetical protein